MGVYLLTQDYGFYNFTFFSLANDQFCKKKGVYVNYLPQNNKFLVQ
jgi:hypothetical protein